MIEPQPTRNPSPRLLLDRIGSCGWAAILIEGGTCMVWGSCVCNVTCLWVLNPPSVGWSSNLNGFCLHCRATNDALIDLKPPPLCRSIERPVDGSTQPHVHLIVTKPTPPKKVNQIESTRSDPVRAPAHMGIRPFPFSFFKPIQSTHEYMYVLMLLLFTQAHLSRHKSPTRRPRLRPIQVRPRHRRSLLPTHDHRRRRRGPSRYGGAPVVNKLGPG